MDLSFLTEYIVQITWQQVVMWCIGGLLIFLAIYKKMEPTLLLPLGFGTILVNFPASGAIGAHGPLTTLYEAGIANELFPLLLFIGIGALIDFGPVLSNPKLMIFGAAALRSAQHRCSLPPTTRRRSPLSARLTVLPQFRLR